MIDVLLVEDDPVIRETTAMVLELYGMRVRTAPDGLSGLSAFRSGSPDVAPLDVIRVAG